MLAASAGFATLAQRNRLAFGIGKLSPDATVGLQAVAEAYAAEFAAVGSDRWSADIVEEAIQEAFRVDAERAYDRFVRQFATHIMLVRDSGDPLWASVTAYYAAFFAANAAMLAYGDGVRVFVAGAGSPFRGLYFVRVAASPTVGSVRLEVTRHTGRDTHRATWRHLDRLVEAGELTGGNSARAEQAFASLRSLITDPRVLSDERNTANYDLSVSPVAAPMWQSYSGQLSSPTDLEDAVLAAPAPLAAGRRFELVAIACASLYSALIRDFIQRGGRRDRRRRRWYEATLSVPNLAWLVS